MPDALEQEVDRNLFAFLPKVPDLLADHEGEFALLRHQKVISLHVKLSEALASAEAQFADGLFSIQQVTQRPVELGFFSYADNPR